MPLFSMNAGGAPGPVMSSFSAPAFAEQNSSTSLSSLKVTKVGVLNRKGAFFPLFHRLFKILKFHLDDLLEGGKRAASRKWREWSLILTGSQLLFFRDTAVALNLLSHTHSGVDTDLLSMQLAFLKPEEILSVKSAVAVYDSSYTKVRVMGDSVFLQLNEMQSSIIMFYA